MTRIGNVELFHQTKNPQSVIATRRAMPEDAFMKFGRRARR